jgi:signal transduction histidine kinase
MTSIRGYSDMLTNPGMVGELSDMQRQLLDVIRANSRRMESLLTDMSYMNRIRGGMVTVNAKMDMFKNISMMVEKKAAPLAEELKRALVFDVPQGLPILNTDADLMSTALLKLIENGLRYSPEGTGEVTVRASADGHTLVITVSDNGVGMTPEEQAHIGEAFYRSDRDVIRAHKGSGLGLPIAIGLTKALGGTFALESTVNQGTTVTLRFEGMG